MVFNTAMTGYQEALTDLSYTEQILIMTTPHIGNTGVNNSDPESDGVSSMDLSPSTFSITFKSPSRTGLDHYLRQTQTPALQGIDTRALVRHIRSKGAMKASFHAMEPHLIKTDAWPGMSGRV